MENDDDSFNIFSSVNTTNPRRQRHRSSSLSNVPALRITTSPIITAVDTNSPVLAEPEFEPKFHPQHLTKRQTELTKLLAHHLSRLKTRPQPPSVFLPLRAASTQKSLPKFSTVADSVRAAVRLKSHVQPQYQTSSLDSDDTFPTSVFSVFSTEIVCDYLVQLRDLLNVSEKQGMRVLYASDIDSTITSRGRATMRRIKSSPQRPRSLSTSTSDHPQRIELLHECIEILRTVILEDARFKNHSFRPTRPPYSLQAVVLDIAHILITDHRHDPATLSRIGFALIPAFYSFDPILHPRLFQFFESGIIRYMLDELHVWRGMEPVMKSPAPYDGNSAPRQTARMPASDSLQVPSLNQGWAQHLSTPITPSASSLSTIAPLQSLTIYQLSSLIPPLLAALLQVVDPTADERDPTKLYKFYSLLDTIVFLKEDAYLDVLEVIAYNDSPTRHRALSVLATYWPRAVGHAIFGQELPVLSYKDVVLFPKQTHGAHANSSLRHPPMRDAPYIHEFIPWRFDSSSSSKHDAFCQACHVCGCSMSGFALLCPFCFVFVHFSCYDPPHGTHAGQYILPSSNKNTTAPAEPKPCFFSYSYILPLRRNMEPEMVKSGQHTFRIVNLFTLSLCMVCNTPLWGHTRQGLKCVQCNAFVHASCVQNVTDTLTLCTGESIEEPLVHTLIEFSLLERTFMQFYQPILFDGKSLEGKQYEEVSIYYSILSAQLYILDNGINCRSIVLQENKRLTMTPMQSFALHKYCAAYAQHLSSPGKAPSSSAMQEYLRFNDLWLDQARCILFDWTLLAGITSILKTPLPHHLTSGSVANNSLSPFNDGRQSEKELLSDASHPYELAGLSHLRNVLSYEFHIHADAAVKSMLDHIRQIGFFERVGEQTDLFTTSDATKDPLCAFSLPLGLDLSTGVETLVVAIEACLEDINIAVNEYGFLLLARRFPPTGAASDYALNRLARILFSWIISEDERLLILARDYIGRGLPGVRTLSEKQPWPFSASSPSSTSTFTAARLGNAAVNSGGEYLFCRRQLLHRHALPWLAAVYELDPVAYANFVFEFCVEVGERADSALIEDVLFEKGNKEWKALEATSKAQRAEAAFRSVIKLIQAGALLSTFDQTITQWLDLFVSLESDNNILAVKALSRLFHRDYEQSRRSLSIPEPNPSQGSSGPPANDPWAVIMDVMSSGLEGFERASRWLRVMSCSGVDIPDENMGRILELAVNFSAPLSLVVLSLLSIVVFSWSKPIGGDGLINQLLHVCEVWIDRIIDDMRAEVRIDMIADFLRYTLIIHLLWYGCSREVIKGTGLVPSDIFPAMSQQRRRVYSRYNADSHGLNVDHTFIKLLTRIAVNGPENICIITAKFLSALVSDSSHIDPQGIDNFILQNGKALAQCAWSFYGLETPEASVLRITFLLRLLVVESQPLENVLNNELRLEDKWQVRFQAAAKLFRVLLDVNSPTFEIAGRQWGLSVSDFFIQFFSSLWLDPSEEIRLAVDAWARTLLPSHLQKITMCWDEYVTKAPLADSTKLVASLVQLHPHFPSWQVLSWRTITEVYNQTYEDEAAYGGTVEPGVADENVVSLRLSLIILGLQMLNEKMNISLDELVQIKFMTTRFLGFSSARRVPTPNGQLFYVQLGDIYEVNEHARNVIQPLLRLLDTSYKLRLPASLLGHWTQDFEDGILGNLFVDIVLKIWEDPHAVQQLSYVPIRGLLESLIVIIVKHDLSSSILKHLDEPMCTAIKTVTDFILLNSNYDIQQLCFAVLSLFLKTYPVLALRILSYQFNVLSSLSSSEEYLLTRTKEFIEAAFVQYEVAGLFWLLSKSGHMEINFLHLLTTVGLKGSDVKKESIHDAILRDTLSQVSANITDPVVASALHNLEKCVTMSEDHSYSDAVVQHFCLRLATIVRQINDTSLFGSKISWDPKPLLSIAITIFERKNPPYFDILEHVDSLLRASLPKYDISMKVLLKIYDCTLKSAHVEYTSWPSRLCHTILDVLSDALRSKVRMSSSNLIATIEVVKSADVQRDARIQVPTLVRLGVDAVSYFSLGREGPFTASDFQGYIAVAKLILSVTNINSSFIGQIMSGDNKNPPSIRVWNLLTLAALEHSDPTVALKLFELLPTFSFLHTITLRFANQSHYDHSALAVNHAFASVKLWLLLARVCHKTTKLDRRNEGSDRAERQVWNALWPPFESLLVHTSDSLSGEVPPLLTFVRGCVTDLILFVRQAHSAVAFDSSSHISILKTLRANEFGGKFNRALRSISEPPLETDFETLRSQVANDVFTAEKLHAVDAIRQGLERRRENTSGGRTV